MISAEQFEQLVKALGSTNGSHNTLLVFVGILALACILIITWWMVNLRLAPFAKLEVRIDKLQDMLTEISSKMWTLSALDNHIDAKIHDRIKEHERDCPFRKHE